MSPDGGTVAVTGNSWVPGADGSTGYDAMTVAYSPAGEQLWVNRYAGPGPGIGYDSGSAVVATDDLVVVTGQSAGESEDDGLDAATIAYHRATGEQRWVYREDQALRSELPRAVRASPSGRQI